MTTPEPIATVTRYDVWCLPEGPEERKHFTIPATCAPSGGWIVGSQYEWFDLLGRPCDKPVEMPLRVFCHGDTNDQPTWEWLKRVVRLWDEREEIIDRRPNGP
ncbi:hypothetical protein [Nocardia sp. NPDC004711]